MKHYIALLLFPLLVACNTIETFDINGKLTSRTRTPTPEFWTAMSTAVAGVGAGAVKSWADQMANQQRWEQGQK